MRYDFCADATCQLDIDAGDIHTLTFLANSGKPMSNGLTVDLATLSAPLADGSTVLVSELSDEHALTLPLLLDHTPSIEKQAGAVKKLWLTEDGLMAQAVVTEETEAGKLVTALANANALTNSFSITVESQTAPGDDGIIHNAELIEISAVYRGADQRAAFTSFNSRQEGEGNKENTDEEMETSAMSTLEKFQAGFALTQDEADELKNIIDGTVEQAADTINAAVDAKTGATAAEETAPIEEAAPVAAARTPQVGFARTKNAGSWVDTEAGVQAFAKTILDNDGADASQVNRLWRDRVQTEARHHSFGISYDPADTPIPKPVFDWIYDALDTDEHRIWVGLNHTGMEAATALFRGDDLDLTDAANRANFYPQANWGTEKTEQVNEFKPRSVRPGFFAKYIAVNRGDIELTRRNRGDESVLLRYLTSELVNRTMASLEYDVLLGSSNDGAAGLFSIASDALAANGYANLVELNGDSPEAIQIAKAAAAVRGTGRRTLVTSAEYLTDLRYGTTANPLLLPVDGGLERMLGVDEIITPDWFTGNNLTVGAKTAKAVIYKGAEYKTVGDRDAELFQNFALKTNQNEFLAEIWTGGALLMPGAGALVTAASE